MALSRHLLLYADGSSSADGNFTLTGNFTIDCITNCIGVCIDDVCLPSPPLSPSSLPFEDGFKPTPVSFRSRDHLLPTLIIAVTSAVVGSFILLMALYSYFRFRRRRRRRRPPLAPAPAGDDSFIDGVDEPLPGSGEIEHHIWYIRTQGLDDSTISSIASWFYKSDDGIVDGKDCSVCLGDFIDGDLIRLLPKCSHAFHLPCIDRWLRSHVNCPLCRAPIVPPSSAGVPAPSPASPPMASDSSEPEPGSSEQVENIQIEGLPWESNIDGTETRIVIHQSEGSSSRTSSPEIHPSLPKPEEDLQPIRRSVSMDSFSLDVRIREESKEGELLQEEAGQASAIREKPVCFLKGNFKFKGHTKMERRLSSQSARLFFPRYGLHRNSILPL